MQIERNLKRSSNLLGEIIEVRYMKEVKTHSEKVEVLKSNHMSHHHGRHMDPIIVRTRNNLLYVTILVYIDIQGTIFSNDLS